MTLTRENTSRFVQAGDVRLHFHEAGAGPVLLCIHGGAPGAFGWGNFGRNLVALSRHFRTLVVDLPGYGQSDKPAIEGPRTGFYANVFVAMLYAGHPPGPRHGPATGGSVALKMAIEHPARIDRSAVINGRQAHVPVPSRQSETRFARLLRR